MSTIDKLTFVTDVDTSGWEAGLATGNRLIAQMYGQIGSKYAALKPPAPQLPGAGSGIDPSSFDQLAARLTATMAGVAGQVRSAMQGATAPLTAFAADFSQKFDQLGPVVRKLAIRIDSAMRFPQIEKRIEATRASILRPFGMIPGMVGKSFDSIADRMASGLGKAAITAKAGMERLKATVTSYDLGDAVHFRPNMATAFIGARARNRKGRITGMQAPPPQAGPVPIPASRAPTSRVGAAVRKVTEDPGWGLLAAAATKAAPAIRAPFEIAAGATAFFARGAAIASSNILGSWLSLAKGRGALSSLTSVAKATWSSLSLIRSPKISVDPKQSTILRGIGSAAEGVAAKMKGLGVAVASALGVFGLAFKGVEFLKSGVTAASGLNETLNKTNAVLGVASGGVVSFADEMAAKFGLVKQETLDVASGFGGLYKTIGGQSGKALEASTIQMTQMAADLSSFANMSFEEAGQALRSVLSGNESDRLRQLGYSANEAALETQGLAMGIRKSAQDMSEQEKMAIRTQIVLRTLKDAQGDLANTSGSSANMFRKVTGSLTNFAATIGTAVMPAIDRGLAALSGLIGGLSAAFGAGGGYFDGFVQKLAIGFDFLAAAIAHPGAAFEVLKLVATQSLVNILESVAVIPPNFAVLADYVGKNWSKLLTDLAINTLTACENIIANFGKIGDAIGKFMANPMGGFPAVDWTPLTQGFLQTADKLPELIRPALTDLSKEIGAAGKPIWDNFAKRRADALKPPAPMNAAKGDAQAGVDKAVPEKAAKPKEQKQFAEIATFGSAEYIAASNRAIYGLPRRSEDKAAKAQQDAVRQLQEVNNNLRKQLAQKQPQPVEQKIR